MDANPPLAFPPAPFDGQRFRNQSGRPANGFGGVLHWMLTRHRPPWPKHVPANPSPRPLPEVDDGTIRVTLIGHATVLLQFDGLNIVTDPMWSDRAGPVSWFGVKRVRPPAITLADLPKIDFVLLSHNHYDHLDRPTLKALAQRDAPLILTGLKVGKAVPSDRIVELDWWQNHDLTSTVRATYVPAEHFSARGPFDRNATLWGGFVLETPSGTIYFAGDTGRGPHFAQIRERFGPITLSLLPIGAYAPRWFMSPVHADPAEAVAAAVTLGSQLTLPIHYGTFPLADDAFADPPRELSEALAATPINFPIVPFGEPVTAR